MDLRNNRVNFEIYKMPITVGFLCIENIFVEKNGKLDCSSEGIWRWRPNGSYPPIEEYWFEERIGKWGWQFDPVYSHLCCYKNAFFKNIVLTIKQINPEILKQKDQSGFPAGNYQEGFWLCNTNDRQDFGRWKTGSRRTSLKHEFKNPLLMKYQRW